MLIRRIFPVLGVMQKWVWFRAKRIKLLNETLCLDSRRKHDLGLVAERCDLSARSQEWKYLRPSSVGAEFNGTR